MQSKYIDKDKSPRQTGFTFVEVLTASLVMGLFMVSVYSIFFSGQQVAGRAAWNQNIASELRIAGESITRAISATSYPSTALSSAIYDAGGTDTTPAANSSDYYVRIPMGAGLHTASEIITGGGIVMQMCSSEVETADSPGVITWTTLRLIPSNDSDEQGTLVLEERRGTFTTAAPDYAMSLDMPPAACDPGRTSRLLNNVEAIEFNATEGHVLQQISVTLHAAYPRDRRLSRSTTSAAVPNIGVRFD